MCSDWQIPSKEFLIVCSNNSMVIPEEHIHLSSFVLQPTATLHCLTAHPVSKLTSLIAI